MTPKQIARAALANIGQAYEESEDLIALTPEWLNMAMAEALFCENSIRKAQGKEILKDAPYITSADMEKELDFNTTLCRTALVFALTANYYTDDDNDYRAADYRARFVNALSEYCIAEISGINDIYADGEED